MAGRIPQHFIDELLNRVDIVDVVDSRVPLRKAGRDYQARCPFHEEKSPSFTVSQNKQFYHCFGCGANGNAIGFLMEYEHMEFMEAVKELAHRAGIEVPLEQSQGKPVDKDLYGLMEDVAKFYRQQLKNHPESATAIDYLKGRGLTGEIAAEYGIGFAPPGWDNLLRALGGSQHNQEQLLTSGMTIQKETNRYYDRFRNRIMFPIRDRRGRVIAFGGRILESDNTQESANSAGDRAPGAANPKYLNSPETPLFHKGRELYGLYEARQVSRHIERLIVVEGYMDVVALAQHGIRNAVATLGTAITSDHLTPLFRTAPEVVFCFDGDRAGRDAAWKALDIVLPEIRDDRRARFMFLPDGEDPDTMVRKIGQANFEKEIDNAMPLANFLLENLLQRSDMSAIDGKARLVELTQPKLAKITNVLARRKIISKLAQQIAMDDIELMRLLGEKPVENQRNKAAQNRNTNEMRGLSPVRAVISLLLNQPQLAQKAAEPTLYLKLEEPGVTLMVELLELLQNNPNLNCGTILEHWREKPEYRHLAKLAQLPLTTPAEGMEAEFLGALTLLDKQRIEREYAFLLGKSETQGLSQEEKHLLTQLQTKKRDLAKQLG